ncbi:MAG: DUF2007 domain-containing protein [Ignavibacteriales bacterium]|nr:DUF2007 domain-containing protein [Ignavibacteriales bacterium]
MPFCPNCKTEFIGGVDECSDCHIKLTDKLTEEAHFLPDAFELVYCCSDVIEAEMLQGNFESAGIDSYILNQQDRSYPGSNNTGLVKIFVKKQHAADAMEFLKALPGFIIDEGMSDTIE